MREARSKGFRARSVFKLGEVDRKHNLIPPSCRVVDLGAAPGSWCEYAASRLSGDGRIVGVDILEMKPIAGVETILGDFTDPGVQKRILDRFEGRRLDLVLSDMSPNITGIRVIDQARAEHLQMSILEFCRHALRSGGSVLTKLFEGGSMVDIRARYVCDFGRVHMIKPAASRSGSREVYLLACDYESALERGAD